MTVVTLLLDTLTCYNSLGEGDERRIAVLAQHLDLTSMKEPPCILG